MPALAVTSASRNSGEAAEPPPTPSARNNGNCEIDAQPGQIPQERSAGQ